MMLVLFALCVLLNLHIYVIASPLKFHPNSIHAYVVTDKVGNLVLSRGQPLASNSVIAEIQMDVRTNSTGWSFVYGWTNGSYPDALQAYAIGYLEAAIDPQIRLQYRNTMGGQCSAPNTTFCKKLHSYLTVNLQFMKSQILSKRATNAYWHQVELLLWQTQGLDDAFKGKGMQPGHSIVPDNLNIDPFGMFLWQLNGGDLSELSDALKPTSERRPNFDGHCSGLVKRTPNMGQLFVAHDTWTGYNTMLRHMKLYEFNFRETASAESPFIAGVSQSFSSYPGSLMSSDDFYVLGSRMVTLETTNAIYNDTLYDIIRESAGRIVFEFLRTQVANRLAQNISEWQNIFATHNSGTYNNQWIVVDYKKVIDGQPLPESGVLGVSEQIPGLVVSKDLTKQLQSNSYWPSYNTPAFPEIYSISRFDMMAKKYGNFFVYNDTARARIFRRDHSKVVDEASMIRLMRYNDFQRDPLSRCDCDPPYSGENTVAARCDLSPANGSYPISVLGHRNHGATDMKLATHWLLNDVGFIGTSSPTYDQQPAFKWSTSGFKSPHYGHPDTWTFPAFIQPWRKVRGWMPSEKSFQMNSTHLKVFPN